MTSRLNTGGSAGRKRCFSVNIFESKLYLGDFGLMIKDGTSINIKQQAPYCFCAPERLHGADPSLASDIWSYMCLLTALYLSNNVSTATRENRRRSAGLSSWVRCLRSGKENFDGQRKSMMLGTITQDPLRDRHPAQGNSAYPCSMNRISVLPHMFP